MDFGLMARGFILGFSLAASVGPIWLLCLQRTLSRGWAYGLASGMGVATADGFYGLVAGSGLTFLSDLLVGQQLWLKLVGGLFLLYLGVKTITAKVAQKVAAVTGNDLGKAYASTLMLTLTNPMTILFFAGIFAGLGLGSTSGNYLAAVLMAAFVFLGSATWWLVMSSGAHLVKNRLKPGFMVWLNRISGGIIAAFGVFALISLFFS